MGSFARLKQVLEEKESFVLVCHQDPDGDAVGSLLGLGQVLSDRGKKVELFCADQIPAIFSYLPGIESIRHDFPRDPFDALILLDNGDMRRTGIVEEIKRLKKEAPPVVNIDHHAKNDLWKNVGINYADEQASSTSEIVYKILSGLDYEISPAVATALLTGIFYDTGGFRHSNTTQTVLDIASDLLKRGAKLRKISENITNLKPISLFKLWGIALNRLRINTDLQISYSVLLQSDLAGCGASEDEISGLVNLLNTVPEARAALLLYETLDGKIKGSLRTERDDVDLATLAKHLGGGGHKKAAGFTIAGKIEQGRDTWKVV